MELRDLKYFAIVAEHQNVGRAAEALGLSATALSKCLRRLEKSVGAKLVHETDAAAFLAEIEEDAAALGSDPLERGGHLLAAVAAP